jgi:putative aminopeptidase FrvX
METGSRTGLAMLELRDLALGITAVLQAVREPEPLAVDLRNHSPQTAAYLVTAVLEECGDAGATLAMVRVDPYVAVAMRKPSSGHRWSYRNVTMEVDAALFQRVEFHRLP